MELHSFQANGSQSVSFNLILNSQVTETMLSTFTCCMDMNGEMC